MKRPGVIVILLTGLVVMVLAVVHSWKGFIHPEAKVYHVNYLSDAPLLSKLYNPDKTEFGEYLCRELSYFFDLLGYRFIDFAIKHNHSKYIPTVNVLDYYLTCILIQYYLDRILGSLPVISSGAALVFWTMPPVFDGVVHLRTAKPGLMLMLASSLVLLARLARGGRRVRVQVALLAGLFLCLDVIGLFGRLGYFMVCGMFVVAVYLVAVCGAKPWAGVAVVAFGSIIFNNICNFVIAPELIHSVTGQYPSLEPQVTVEIGRQGFVAALASNPKYFVAGLFGVVTPLRCLVWDLPLAVCFALVPYVWYRLRAQEVATGVKRRRNSNLFLLILLLINIIYVLMYSRHWQAFTIYDVQRNIYNGPAAVLLLFLLPWRAYARVTLPFQPKKQILSLAVALLVLKSPVTNRPAAMAGANCKSGSGGAASYFQFWNDFLLWRGAPRVSH